MVGGGGERADGPGGEWLGMLVGDGRMGGGSRSPNEDSRGGGSSSQSTESSGSDWSNWKSGTGSGSAGSKLEVWSIRRSR